MSPESFPVEVFQNGQAHPRLAVFSKSRRFPLILSNKIAHTGQIQHFFATNLANPSLGTRHQ